MTKLTNMNTVSKVETLGKSLLNAVSNGQMISTGNREWIFNGLSNGEMTSDYRLVVTDKLGKSGRTFMNRQLYRKNSDGTEKIVEFGKYKKDYLYKAVHQCISPKKNRVKLLSNHDLIFKIRDDVRINKTNYHLNEETNQITGTCPGVGSIVLFMGTYRAMKNNHHRKFGRELYVDGKLTVQGGDLEAIVEAVKSKRNFNKKK